MDNFDIASAVGNVANSDSLYPNKVNSINSRCSLEQDLSDGCIAMQEDPLSRNHSAPATNPPLGIEPLVQVKEEPQDLAEDVKVETFPIFVDCGLSSDSLFEGKSETQDNSVNYEENSVGHSDSPSNDADDKMEDPDLSLTPKASSGPTSRKKRETRRFCIFCKQLRTNLSKHLVNFHKNEEEIKSIVNLSQEIRHEVLKQLRIKGIEAYNEMRVLKGESPICLRKQSNFTKKSLCSNCNMIFSSKSIYMHKKRCLRGPTPRGSSSPSCPQLKEQPRTGQDFRKDISSRLSIGDGPPSHDLTPEGEAFPRIKSEPQDSEEHTAQDGAFSIFVDCGLSNSELEFPTFVNKGQSEDPLISEKKKISDAEREEHFASELQDVAGTENFVHPPESQSDADFIMEDSVSSSWKETSAQTSRKRKEPPRFCIFCKQLRTNLSKHQIKFHRNEPEIKDIMKLNQEARHEALKQLRIQGIKAYNEMRMLKGESPICLRNQNGLTKKSLCSNCNMIFSSKNIYLHKKKCFEGPNTKGRSLPVSATFLTQPQTHTIGHDFLTVILDRLKTDEVGNFIRKEFLLHIIGSAEYENVKADRLKYQTQKRVCSHIRRIATLYLKFYEENKISFLEMFNVDYYSDIIAAFHKLYSYEDSRSVVGTRSSMDTSITKATTALLSYSKSLNDEETQMKLYRFLLHHKDISAKASLESSFTTPSKSSTLLPAGTMLTQDDIDKLTEFVVKEFDDLSSLNSFNHRDFLRLRRVTACRLAILNGWRQGEVSQLTIHEWQSVKDNALPEELRERLSPSEMKLLELYRVVYSKIDASSKTIPILVPPSCFWALDVLSDQHLRDSAQINPQNGFLFPSSLNSLIPSSEYHDTLNLCSSAGVAKKISAKQMRELVFPVFLSLDAPQETQALLLEVSNEESELPKGKQIISGIISLLEKIHSGYSDVIMTSNEESHQETTLRRGFTNEEGHAGERGCTESERLEDCESTTAACSVDE